MAKEAGIGKPTNLKVVNRSGRNITIDICHDGYCIGNKTLKDGESDQAAGENINGWVKYDWGMGNGWQQNQYTGVLGNAAGPYQIDFKRAIPNRASVDRGAVAEPCGYHTSSQYGGGNDNPARWPLGVGDKSQSPSDSLCTYSMVASRADDGGTDRARAPGRLQDADARGVCPDRRLGLPSIGCTWELTPGPVRPPESPDGSWSCWAPGPKPPQAPQH